MAEVELSRNGFSVKQSFASNGDVLVGRDYASQVVVPSDWPECSRRQALLWWESGSWWLRDGVGDRPSINGTYLPDGTPASTGVELGPGPDLCFLISRGPLEITVTIRGLRGRVSDGVQWAESERGARDVGSVMRVGRSPGCDLVLDDPCVSRLHALLTRNPDGSAILDDCSRNGIFVDGRRVGRRKRISEGAILQIGRIRCVWRAGELLPLGDSEHYDIQLRQVQLPGRLHDISLSIDGGQLVALVGGSGAGKSSLLTTMAGHSKAYRGLIAVAGEDLRHGIDALRPQMGFVPQDDILHEELTVQEVLSFAARLRLPDPDAQRQSVERVLDVLEIAHRRGARVRQLSGGQRKRVSIGMELVADPRLLFLDEPTSGLDPGLDRRMMRLLRQLADRGQTVVLVTHATANVNLCDQVVFLGRGGHPCYAGPPHQCLQYFGVAHDFAEVYEQLDRDDQSIQASAERFQSSVGGQLPSVELLPPGANQGVSPASLFSLLPHWQRGVSQIATLVHREFLISLRDRVSLLLNLGTGPIAILLLALAIQNPGVFTVSADQVTPESLPLAIKVVFLISCVCLWSGISSQIGSVARERSIYERERGSNLIPAAYVMAKVLQMVVLALLQSILISMAVVALFELPEGLGIGPAGLGYVMAAFLSILASGSLGLVVSTLVRDQRQASSSSPILLLPQLILSGVLFKVERLSFLFPLVASRWSVKLFGAFSGVQSLQLASGIPGLSTVDVTPYMSTTENVREACGWLLLQWIGYALLALVSLSRKRGL